MAGLQIFRVQYSKIEANARKETDIKLRLAYRIGKPITNDFLTRETMMANKDIKGLR